MNGEAARDIWVDSWFTIWYQPRATIRRIVDTDPRKFVLAIAWCAGAVAALNSALMASATHLPSGAPHLPQFGPMGIAFAAILFGLFSIVGLYAAGALYRWSGHILGGTATAVEVRAALAWAQVPGLYLAAVTIIATMLGLITPTVPPSISTFNVIESIIAIWLTIIALKCLGEVHRFSAWRALGAILLGSFAVIAVVFGVVITIWLAVRIGR
jgi:hypothetical protein